MITVLLLEKSYFNFEPLLEKNKSVSLLPVSISNNLLGMMFSWINSYFSKDKIFVVCTPEEEQEVMFSCKGIDNENIIIEPARINYSISIFYATLVVNKIVNNETILFLPVNFLFSENFKIGNTLFALDEISDKKRIILPSTLIGRDERESEYIDAGKIFENNKGIDFFNVENISISKEEFKKKKLFGKYGRLLKIICGNQKVILNSFMQSLNKNLFINILYEHFDKEEINWEKIKNEYVNVSNSTYNYNYFEQNRIFLTIFLDTKPNYLDNWSSFQERFASRKDGNLISGKVNLSNCKSIICINYDEEEILINNLQDTIIFRKNGLVAIKNIQNINEEVNDAISKKEKKSKNS